MIGKKGMTGVMTGEKGYLKANIAPKMPKNSTPTPAPKGIELATSIHTQNLITFFLQIFKGSYINFTSRAKS